MDRCTILNILLDIPEELDLKHKPPAIGEDNILDTLRSRFPANRKPQNVT